MCRIGTVLGSFLGPDDEKVSVEAQLEGGFGASTKA